MSLKAQMENIIKDSYSNIGGIIVLKNGKAVYENYYNECNSNSTFHIFSVTKSIVSILLGIAIDKGYINSVDQKVLEFFPDYIIKKGETTIQSISLKDMLTMTVPYKFDSEPYEEYFESNNWVNSALDLLGGTGKLGEFRYAPVIGPDIFSGILVKSTGQSVINFAKEYLFSPLDIHIAGSFVFHSKEEQLAWYEKKNTSGWASDNTGVNTAGWGLSLTAMDMAKLGQLYIDEGVWKGKQLISSEWIRQSTTEHSIWEQFNLSYGYLWWVIDQNEHSYAAMGDGGNVIYVNPKKKIAISIASFFMSYAKDRIQLIKEYIEPVFEDCV